MQKIIKTITLYLIPILFITGCATSWQSTNHYDEFTNTKMCRVEKGTQGQRDFAKGFTGIYFTQHFYAENYNGEIRAGVRTEPPLPIAGDIQIKVGDNLYILTSQDAPLDIVPNTPNMNNAKKMMGKEYVKAIEAITKNIQQLSSPYRAYTGNKAKELLRDISNTDGEIKFRVVNVNSVVSGTGSFTTDKSFITSLVKCGIKL